MQYVKAPSAGRLHLDFFGPQGHCHDPASGHLAGFERFERRHLVANAPGVVQARFAWRHGLVMFQSPWHNAALKAANRVGLTSASIGCGFRKTAENPRRANGDSVADFY